MTYLEKDNYRIQSIYKLGEGEQDTRYGLGIEKKYEFGDSWYVICFIKWDKKEPQWYIDSVGHRLINIDSSEWDLVKKLIQVAGNLVYEANNSF